MFYLMANYKSQINSNFQPIIVFGAHLDMNFEKVNKYSK